MATEYFIMAGDQVVDQVDVSGSDRGFFEFVRKLKLNLSSGARVAFDLVSEYEMYPDDGEPEKRVGCSGAVLREIEDAWLER